MKSPADQECQKSARTAVSFRLGSQHGVSSQVFAHLRLAWGSALLFTQVGFHLFLRNYIDTGRKGLRCDALAGRGGARRERPGTREGRPGEERPNTAKYPKNYVKHPRLHRTT